MNRLKTALRSVALQLLLTATLLLGATAAWAQTASEKQIISKINSTASALKTMQCDFVQTKHLRLLGDNMTVKGRMYYQQSDKLRWEYTSPYTYTFVLNGQRVMLRSGKKTDVIDVNQSKLFKEIARIMMNSVVGKSLSDTKDFKVSIQTTDKEWVATLLPQRREMKQMFQRIVLHFSRTAAMVSTVELYERQGDHTVIQLKNVQKNKPVNAKLFLID